MRILRTRWCVAVAIGLLLCPGIPPAAVAQDVAAVSPDATAAPVDQSGAMSEEDLEILVARIALYPDDLIAVILAASVYPLQIVEAQRYLEQVKGDASLQPKDSWDGSVISLLNYPDVVKMMSDDLEWTQDLGNALAYQQQDVLVAVQQLRDEAVAKGIIKTDDKITVTSENDNVVIQPTSEEVVYVPQYEPEMLYVPDYEVVPIGYYPDPYPYYYSPAATYFAGFVTGTIWGAMVDWNDWGVWGGNWGNDIDVNCNNCFNNITGKVRAGDIDWRNVDRSKVSFDRDQFKNVTKRDSVRNSIKTGDNNIRNKATTARREHAATTKHAPKADDIRKSAHAAKTSREHTGSIGGGDRQRPGAGGAGERRDGVANRTGNAGERRDNAGNRAGGKAAERHASTGGAGKKAAAHHQSKPKPAAKRDSRPKKPSGLGEVRSGKKAAVHSSKGRQAMGGGGGRPHKSGGGGGRRGGGRR